MRRKKGERTKERTYSSGTTSIEQGRTGAELCCFEAYLGVAVSVQQRNQSALILYIKINFIGTGL